VDQKVVVAWSSNGELMNMGFAEIGIIGDVHAEADYLEIALHFFQMAQVEKILCVGDIVDGRGNVDCCCNLLDQAEVVTVRGNHDRWFVEGVMRDSEEATQWSDISETSHTFMRSLPNTKVIETITGRLLLCHGLGENDMQRLTPDDYGYALEVIGELHSLVANPVYKFVVNGHTHRRMVRRFENLTVINAGTLYAKHEPCIAIANFRTGFVQFYDFQEKSLVRSGEPIRMQ
jgi:putative phosphoesterase